ncbi:hypothetical protein GALL_173750 [mine drainage metagenome]|uniref:Uncharacterized protein n=1 Tax=mine drainage metagenome TaxID=410659 RepID=A0A1J5SK81_9ZZZZ
MQQTPSTTEPENQSGGVAPAGAHRRVVIAGASGLVGRCLLRGLLNDASVGEVHALGRRRLDLQHPKLRFYRSDFRTVPPLPPVDEVFLALGTMIKQTGSREGFRAVDFEATLAVAQAAMAAGARRIGVVSAMNADVGSSLFYCRVKGDMEAALSHLQPDALVIVRPSYLLGNRAELNQPVRYGEKIGLGLSLLLRPVLPLNYRPVEASQVADVLLTMVPTSHSKTIILSGEIYRFGRAPDCSRPG